MNAEEKRHSLRSQRMWLGEVIEYRLYITSFTTAKT